VKTSKTVIIIGAGPAGLMAAEVIKTAGHQVQIFDAKPSACRKFLLAGVGGMNITHSEPYPLFIQRYYDKANWLNQSISAFNPDDLRNWIHQLGIDTFVGSSGKVFPKEMKAAPLLRKWLKRLRESGIQFHMRHRLINIDQKHLTFQHNEETVSHEFDAVVLALGGASWSKLGSDGAWQTFLADKDISINPLQSANCGFLCEWSEHLKTRFEGTPLKNIAFNFITLSNDNITRKGECIVTRDGMEGSLIYAYSKHLRESINATGISHLSIDLLPDISKDQLKKKLQTKQGKDSFSKYLKRTTGLTGIKAALLYERCNKSDLGSTDSLIECIKTLPVSFTATKPIEEAISSAGGICEESLNKHLMLNTLPGVFCAGEMLDWEAPTGGYLLTACFATGRLAGQGVVEYLKKSARTHLNADFVDQ
jgi:uncharacterized flavoprotein (TIGR03862 family)